MSHQLTSEQIRCLEKEVATGRFASVEDAVQAAIVGLVTADVDDGDWVVPLLDEARQSMARGDGLSLEEYKAAAMARRARRGTD